MKEQKFYREPWTPEKVDFLCKWWPHFGSRAIFEQKMIEGVTSQQQIKSKADMCSLQSLPKNQRFCVDCKIGHQFSRRGGSKCRVCHLKKRKNRRKTSVRSIEVYIKDLLRTKRYQNRTVGIDYDYLLDLWRKQDGKCFYSGISMREKVEPGRDLFTPSLDRVDPSKGYVKENVVWACFGCNVGKWDMLSNDYLLLCNTVAKNNKDIIKKLIDSNYKLNHELPSPVVTFIDRQHAKQILNQIKSLIEHRKTGITRTEIHSAIGTVEKDKLSYILRKGVRLKLFRYEGSGAHIMWFPNIAVSL